MLVSLGSNIEAERNIREAVRWLRAEMTVLGVSTIYRTAPIGNSSAPSFLNGVIMLETELSPLRLKFELLRRIEAGLGRRRTDDKYAPRPIDLDILLYDNLDEVRHEIAIPDPELTHRPFLAIPAAELMPEMVVPGVGKTLRVIAAGMEHGGMEPLVEYSALLKEEARHGQRQC